MRLTSIVHILSPETDNCPSLTTAGRTRNLLITSRMRIQLSHPGRHNAYGKVAKYFILVDIFLFQMKLFFLTHVTHVTHMRNVRNERYAYELAMHCDTYCFQTLIIWHNKDSICHTDFLYTHVLITLWLNKGMLGTFFASFMMNTTFVTCLIGFLHTMYSEKEAAEKKESVCS